MKRVRVLQAVFTAGLLALLVFQAPPGGVTNAKAFNYSKLNAIQKRILSGAADLELNPSQASARAAISSPGNFAQANVGSTCSATLGSNVKVNQNCLNLSDTNLQGRGQAQNETAMAVDPMRPNHLVASYNDYRRGDGTCGTSFSLDGGRSWTDSTTPNGFTSGADFGAARQYWQAGGDTSVAFDTRGNAYLNCQVFQRGQGVPPTTPNPDLSSGFFVFRSTGTAGASWNFVGRQVLVSPDLAGTGAADFLDKPYMTVDNHTTSPFRDRVYVTWTTFTADGTAYIYGASSNDYGETFSAPVLVSRNSTLCSNTFGAPTPYGKCNENQFSDPFTGANGALYVTWANYNNTVSGNDNRNQIMLAKSTDGGATFSAPVKVSDYYELPDCATYQGGQDPGRACVPEQSASMNSVFRAANYPSGQVRPGSNSQIVVTFGSYINKHSNESNGCTPAGILSPPSGDGNNVYTGVKTPGACNNDILVSVSHDGGHTFTGTTTDPRQLTSATNSKADQFFQWSTFTAEGTLAVSYFDRSYGSDAANGSLDESLSVSQDLSSFEVQRVTSSSMPVPTQFPDSQGNGLFMGDYNGLAAFESVSPIWPDTRNVDLFLCPGTGTPGHPPRTCTLTTARGLRANDQEIFTATLSIGSNGPNG
jgi:hypothetical protein